MKKPITPEAARIRMADLCARSEQCEEDIRTKLFRLGIPSDATEEIIIFLLTNKFIDNGRFARSFARDKCRFSSWGKNKIKVALMAKRISTSEIEEALESIEGRDYLDALRRVTLSKGRTLDILGETSREDKMKLYRHLLNRGFESRLASGAVRSYEKKLLRERDNQETTEP